MWRISPSDNMSCGEISPHGRFFSTGTSRGARDKYEVCAHTSHPAMSAPCQKCIVLFTPCYMPWHHPVMKIYALTITIAISITIKTTIICPFLYTLVMADALTQTITITLTPLFICLGNNLLCQLMSLPLQIQQSYITSLC